MAHSWIATASSNGSAKHRPRYFRGVRHRMKRTSKKPHKTAASSTPILEKENSTATIPRQQTLAFNHENRISKKELIAARYSA